MPLSDKQLAIRKLGITASEAPAVVGLNPYVKPIDVFAQKLGLVDPFEGNKASRWGDLLEEPIAQYYAHQHAAEKIVVRHPRTIPGSIDGTLVRNVSPRFQLIATPDRLVYHKRLPRPFRNLQIKTAGLRQEDNWGEPGTDQIPEHYLIQVAAEMAVVDVSETDLVVLIGGQDDREYRVPRDLELEGQILEICERFWVDHIMTGIPPPVDGSEQYADYLKRRFPRDVRPMLPATEEAEYAAELLRNAKVRLAEAEQSKALHENALKALIADAGGIEGICTWRQNKDSIKVSWEAVAKHLLDERSGSDRQEIIERYTTTTPGARPFKFVTQKEK